MTRPTPTHQSPARSSPILVMVGVSGIYASFGLLMTSTGALVPSIRADLDLSRGQMGLVLGAWQLAYIAASVPAGRVIDRIGLRKAILVSISIMVLSTALRAGSQGFVSLLLAVAVLGIGGPLISIGAPKAAATLFTGSSRRRAVGIYQASPAIGSAIALATANGAVSDLVGGSWRWVSLFFAGIGALAGVMWMMVSTDLDVGESEDQPAQGVLELLKLPIMRFTLVIAVAGFAVMHGVSQWLVDLLADGGRSLSDAGYLASVGSVFGMVFTLLIPTIATPRRRTGVLVAALLIAAFGTASLTADGSSVIFAIAASSAKSGLLPLSMLMLMDDRDVGPRNMAVAAGIFLTAAQVGGFGGPYLTGLLADSSGSFDTAMTAYAALLSALAVFILMVGPRVLDPSRSRRSRRQIIRSSGRPRQ